MRVIKLSGAAIELEKRLTVNPWHFTGQLPCYVKQYCVEDVVVFPDGQLVNKDYLVIED